MRNVIRLRMEIYAFLMRCLGKRKKMMPVYVLLLLFMTVTELLTPQLYSIFVDRVLLNGDRQMFGYVAMGYCALFMAGCGASVLSCILINKLRNTLEYGLRREALCEVIYPWKANSSPESIGDVKLKMDQDIGKLSECLQEQFGKFEVKLILLVFSGVYLFFLNWKLALLGILAIPVTIWIDFKIGQKENRLNEENRQNDSNMSSWLFSLIKGWRQIKMFGQEKNQKRNYVRFWHKFALYNAKWIHYWVMRDLIIPKLKNEFLMEFGVYFIGGIFLLQGTMSVGDLLVFILYYHLLTDSMTVLSKYQADLQSDLPIYRRAMSWNKNRGKREGLESVLHVQKIELEKISFRYSSELPELFENVNGVFERGDCIHIKGKSGSGKTTLVKVMLGQESLKRGRILINGNDLMKTDLPCYYNRISGSLQGTCLFHDSIRENLLYVKPDAAEEELKDACKKARILEDILAMPEQWDTVVGDRGSRLSGGQCQRLLLARAFLKDADVYFFDEVTSALDKQTAVFVLEEIEKLSKEKIVFLISHDAVAGRICNEVIEIPKLL